MDISSLGEISEQHFENLLYEFVRVDGLVSKLLDQKLELIHLKTWNVYKSFRSTDEVQNQWLKDKASEHLNSSTWAVLVHTKTTSNLADAVLSANA